MAGEKVLIVDDEKSMCQFLSIMLRKEGYDITAVNNGKKALEQVGGSKFDLVITDIKMSGMDGIELLSEIKKVDQAVYFYRGHKAGILVWMAAGMANHALSVASVMLIGRAMRVGMPPYEYFALVPVINIASALPLGPNGWGVGEALYRLLFGKYGAAYLVEVPRETATLIMGTRGVALSVVFRVHMTLWSLLGGLMILFDKDRVTRRDIEEEVKLEEEEKK